MTNDKLTIPPTVEAQPAHLEIFRLWLASKGWGDIPASRIVVCPSKTPEAYIAEHQGEPAPDIFILGGHTRALRWDQLSIYYFPDYALVYDDKKWPKR